MSSTLVSRQRADLSSLMNRFLNNVTLVTHKYLTSPSPREAEILAPFQKRHVILWIKNKLFPLVKRINKVMG